MTEEYIAFKIKKEDAKRLLDIYYVLQSHHRLGEFGEQPLTVRFFSNMKKHYDNRFKV